MKKILVAMNAKYIHSNLAVYNLKAYAEQKEKIEHIEIAEYTINQQLDDILMDLYKKKPGFVAFSCYIWNIEYVETLVREVRKLLPQVPIWLGGPEVSFDALDVLKRLPQVTGVMKFEGEETFAQLLKVYEQKGELSSVRGIAYREGEQMLETATREILDLDKVPFVYQDLSLFENKIIYYESSRGCPFSCSYCLSSIDKKLRFRSVELVKKELQHFLDAKVSQVKFVDRTFNCNHKHSVEIWKYIKEHDNGVTNFHFEVAADIMNEEELAIIGDMRKGLIQLEIGVQSTYQDTIEEIRRVMDFEEVKEVVRKVQKGENIHQHLDLIAGLPFEGYDRFKESFNDVYSIQPEQLQLGFLKVLKGSYMYEKRADYGIEYHSKAPYEILYNNWLSYEDVIHLKGIEDMVETYYNSGQFKHTIKALEDGFETAFQMYEHLSDFYEQHALNQKKHSRISRYEILYDFILQYKEEEASRYRDLLLLDLYLRENSKSRPAFAKEYEVDKEKVRAFFEKEQEERLLLPGYEGFDKRQMAKMTHVEVLQGEHVLFDYRNRDPLSHDASLVRI